MKKIFTLIAMALVAIGVNAQTATPDEKYSAFDDEGNLEVEFDADKLETVTSPYLQSIAHINRTYMDVKLVDGANPADVLSEDKKTQYGQDVTVGDFIKKITEKDSDGNDIEVDVYSCTVNSWNTPTWKTGSHGDTGFKWVQGSGNPYTGLSCKKATKDGELVKRPDGTQAYTVLYDYYKPDGSVGLPLTGEYLEFTAKEDGMVKIKCWLNKGGSRYLYIVDKETAKAIQWSADKKTTQYKVEGYVNGQKNTDGTMKFFDYMTVENYLVEQSNQVRLVWFVFDMKKDKTYQILGADWQFGFSGYEFYKGKSIVDYEAKDPAGIESVKTIAAKNANAPIYNLAGQKVAKDFKGIVIQNGKKFVVK